MSVLRSINGRLERMVEGVFGKAFKASVQPVELAHKLAKEMADHKVVSVARVYVPNEYEIYLSTPDFEHLSSFEEALMAELSNYLTAYAGREGWSMVTEPRIALILDDELGMGEFGIATHMGAREAAAPSGAPAGAPAPPVVPPAVPAGMAQTVLYQPPAPPAAPPPQSQEPRLRAFLRGPEGSFELAQPVMILGRSKRCDIVLADPNVSRQHAEVRLDNGDFVVTDLDSTNGVKVNGRPVKRAVLNDGDRLELGTAVLRFERRS